MLRKTMFCLGAALAIGCPGMAQAAETEEAQAEETRENLPVPENLPGFHFERTGEEERWVLTGPVSDDTALPEQVTDESGNVWRLDPASREERKEKVPGEVRKISTERVFREFPGGEIPASLVLPAGEAGEDLTLNLSSSEVLREYWKEDVEILLTFHRYGADSYAFGDVMVQADASSPDPDALLPAAAEAVGADPGTLKLLSCRWAGESYTDDGGVMCRDATIQGERKLMDIRATYRGEYREEDTEMTYLSAAYEREEPETEATAESVRADHSVRILARATPSEPAGPLSAPPEEPPQSGSRIQKAMQFVRKILEIRSVRVSLFALLLIAAGTAAFFRIFSKIDTSRRNSLR